MNIARAELGASGWRNCASTTATRACRRTSIPGLSPTPLPDPYLVAFNPAAAELIGLAPAEAARAEFAEIFCGNRLLPGFDPLAAIYAGHQFGVFVPQLGDGRAILLGEATGALGSWDLQLKGAGKTPYSRMGDGRAVLRSSIREYLASEAMHALGIPTTRALAIVGSDEPVIRENIESAAVLTRMASEPCALRLVRAVRLAPPARAGQNARRLRHRPALPAVARGAPALSGAAERSHRAHREADRTVAGRGLLPRRDEHRQYVHPRTHHRLRSLRLHRGLRLGPRLQPFR